MVSIIVVTDNTNELLKRCLDSVLSQNYRDFEVLLIDNSISGMASDICKKYLASYSQINKLKTIPVSNPAAKNIGLEIATGDYVFFINGSDYIAENTLANMVSAMEETGSDICICGSNINSADGIDIHNNIINKELSQQDLLQKLIDPLDFLYVKTENKLYKKSIFKTIRFEENNEFSNDFIAHKILSHCEKAICLESKYYTYEKTYNVSDKYFYSKDNISTALVYYYRYKYLKKINPTIAKSMRKLCYHFIAYTLRNHYHTIHVLGYEAKYREIISKLILSFGLNPRGLKLLTIYKKIESTERKEINVWLKLLKSKVSKIRKKYSKVIFLLATPIHGNLGDQAIVFAEKHFISQNGYSPDQILEISNDDYLKYHDLIKKVVHPQDIIIIDGGGNMGTLWPWEDDKISAIISDYQNNTIRIFPQTMYYDNTDFGTERLHKNRQIYQKTKNLHILLRDKKSFDFASKNFENVKFTYTPDVVLYIDNLDLNNNRNGVLFCFREDLEKNISNERIENIKNFLENKSIKCHKTSTVVDYTVTQNTRNDELMKKWNQFASSRLVITDRLHAMIFAAITGTPCIAFDNLSKKVSGVYEWIKELPYIKCVNTNDDIQNDIEELYSQTDCNYVLPQKLSDAFDNFI